MRYYIVALIALTLVVIPFPTTRAFISSPTADPPAVRAKVIGYERDAFGPGWARTEPGCTTRTDAMADAFSAEACDVPYAQWDADPISDPYTGDELVPADVEIDHLYPLSAAWDTGAHSWPETTRIAFANDPDNLVVTSKAANRAKSDKLPSEWLPPNSRAQCAYGRALVKVATRYDLDLPREDLTAVRRACSGLTGLFGRLDL